MKMDADALSLLLPEQYSYKILNCIGTPAEFTAIIRTNLSSADDVKPWVDKFGQSINCTFISYHSQRRKQAKVFKSFRCHLSKKNKTRPVATKSAVPDLTERNHDCEASIMVWIMNDDEEFSSKGFPARIDIIWKHSHDPSSIHILKLLRPLKETKELFEGYFSQGHSVKSAISKNLERCGPMGSLEAVKMRRNKAYCPTQNVAWHWYQTWRKQQFGDWLNSFDAILKNEKSINESGTILRVVKDPFAVLVITPLMQRAHQLLSASDIIFVDSTSTCDSENHSITFMLTQSCVGAVPVAVFITSDQTEKSYVAAFSLLKAGMPKGSFGGQGQPKLFMTDDATAEKNALKAVWPGADQKNCIFHMAQAQWRWLWDGKHKINQEHRKPIMDDFRKIMFSTTEADAARAFNEAISNIKKLQSAEYSLLVCIGRFETLWNRKIDWVIAFRDHHSRGNFTNNFAEITVRLFKENVLGRRKSYNAASLVDVICSEMEEMYRSRLLDFAHCCNNAPYLEFNGLLQKSAYITKEMVQVGENGIYSVPSENGGDTMYDVDTKIGYCSCKVGMFGRFCKHAAAVFKYYERSYTNRPPVTYIERHQMAVLALGQDAGPPRIYRALNEKVVEGTSENLNCPEVNERSSSEDQVQEAMDVEGISVQEWPVSTRRKESINLEDAKEFTEVLLKNLSDHKDNEALAKAFKQFKEKLMSQCNGRPSRLATLLSSATLSIGKTRKAGAKIPLQHFSASRRKQVTKGASVTSAGRAANVLRHKPKCGRVPMQKRRNLGQAIKENRPNAKGHSTK